MRALQGTLGRAVVVSGLLAAGATAVSAVSSDPPPSVVYSSTVQADAPVGFWRLGDGDGTAADASGAGRNGSYAGPVGHTKGALVDDGNKSLKLNDNTPTNAQAVVPDDGSLSIAGDLTIEAWVNSTGSTGNYQMIVTKSPGANAGKASGIPSNYELWLRPDLVPEFRETAGEGNPIVKASSPVALKTWTHLVVTRAGNKVSFFLNGVPAGGGSTGIGDVKTNSLPVRIGSREDMADTAYFTFRGALDEVAVYNKALAPDRVALHYKAGTDPASLAPTTTAAPVTEPPTTAPATTEAPATTAAPTTAAPTTPATAAAATTVATTAVTSPPVTTGSGGINQQPIGTTPPAGPIAGTWPTSPQAINAAVCDAAGTRGPAAAPTVAGYIAKVVTPATLATELGASKNANGGKVLFFFTPGNYSISQIVPTAGNMFVGGAPTATYPKGAVLTPSAGTKYAFGGGSASVTLKYLTIQGFPGAWPAYNEGIVNHDSADNWLFEGNTIQDNHNAAMMLGTGNVVRSNCLRNNGQYAFNAYEAASNGTDVTIENNEISGNNTDEMEMKFPGCGCSGGGKFWVFANVTYRNNWVHDNKGAGLWTDGNNNGFMITNNIFENNTDEAVAYEVSYNAVIANNLIRNNMTRKVTNGGFRPRSNTFPDAAVYISDASGAANVPNKFGITTISVTGNFFDDNPNGITLFPNLMRGCSATKWWLVSDNCNALKRPLAGGDQWGVKNVNVSGNTFRYNPARAYATCQGVYCGRNSVFAGRQGTVTGSGGTVNLSEQTTAAAAALVFDGTIRFANNRYIGDWHFTPIDTSCVVPIANWQKAGTPSLFGSFATANNYLQCGSHLNDVGFGQDKGSTIEAFK